MSSVSFFQLLRSKLSELSEFRRKTGAIRRDWGAVLNAADLDASTSQGTQGRLTTRTRGLGALATSATDLNVQGSDTELMQRAATSWAASIAAYGEDSSRSAFTF